MKNKRTIATPTTPTLIRPLRQSSFEFRAEGRVSERGVTLSETLVALLVMSIGIISLASLFPIAVLKTARANQLTVATNIRYNAEAMMKMYPQIYFDPNSIDSDGDGLRYNDYNFTASQPYLFDPLGLVNSLPISVGYIPRFGGGFEFQQQRAEEICSSLDNWTVLHEGAITSALTAGSSTVTIDGLSGITLPSLPDPLNLAKPGVSMRVHLMYVTSAGERRSITRAITYVDVGNLLKWTEDLNSNNSLDSGEDVNANYGLDLHGLPTLPFGSTYDSARLEARQRKYSWLAVVRPQSDSNSFIGGSFGAAPTFDITVAVYFGRGFSLEEEAIFGIPPGPPVFNAATGTTKITAFEGQPNIVVDFQTDGQPSLKRGGYLLDVQNGYWYQIQSYTEITPSSTTSTITLTSNVTKSFQLAMFPSGVVDVFPISAQSP